MASVFRNRRERQFLYSVLLLGLLGFLACGKRRPPLPPIERVPQRTELLSGVQRGNQVLLSWPAPLRNAPDPSVQSIRRIDVYRLAESPSAPLALTEEEFAARSTLVGSVTENTIRRATDTITYTDTLELAGEQARLRYAVRYVNAAGQRAAFSNFVLIEPAARVARPPSNVQVTPSETALTVAWEAPATNIDNSSPVNLLGYNIYRATGAQNEPAQIRLNPTVITATRYADKSFNFGETYSYVVRSVSLGTSGNEVESLNSNTAAITPHDIYPPSPPSAIRIAAGPGKISLFFPANPERDVAGYIIYRSTEPSLQKSKWERLTPELLKRTTFQDANVESGKRYYYYLQAVDTSGNISDPSEVVSEQVP